MNKYIQMFMDDNGLKVGDEFKAKGLKIDRTWHFDENGYLLDGVYEESGNVLSAFLRGEWEVEKVKKEPWKPEIGERYYFNDIYSDVVWNTYNDDDYDRYILDHNLVFQTKKEAEDYKWFLDKVDEYKKPFILENFNYFIYCARKYGKVYTGYDYLCQAQGVTYFGDKENIDKFLEEVGKDRIKKYWFKVEEE